MAQGFRSSILQSGDGRAGLALTRTLTDHDAMPAKMFRFWSI